MSIGNLIFGTLNNGRVGIGTSSPLSRFHVLNGSADCTAEIESNSGRPVLKMDGTTGLAEIMFEENGSYQGALGYNYTNDNLFFFHGHARIESNSGAPQLFIDGTGGQAGINFQTSGTTKTSLLYDNSTEYTHLLEADGDDIKFRDGDIIIDGEYKYNSAQTCYLSIPSAAFHITNTKENDRVKWDHNCSFYLDSDEGDGIYYVTAPVLLPEGALVVEVKHFCNIFSNSNECGFNAILYKKMHYCFLPSCIQVMSEVEYYSNNYNYGPFTDTSIEYPYIDNQSNTYYIYLRVKDFYDGGYSFRYFGVIIEYTLDRVTH